MVFASGLSVMFYLSITTDISTLTLENSLRVLVRCEDTLRKMGTKLPDAKAYVTAFEVLHRSILSKGDQGPSRPDTGTASHSPLHRGTATPQHPEIHSNMNHGGEGTGSHNYLGPEGRTVQHPYAEWLPTHAGQNTHIDMGPYGDFSLNNDFLHSDFLNGDAMWNMEAGLGEYAYGDPSMYLQNFNGTNFNI